MEEKEIISCSKNFSENTLNFSIQQIKCYDFIVEYLQPLTKENIDWLNISIDELSKFMPLNEYGEFEIKINFKELGSKKTKHKEKIIEEIGKLKSTWIKINGNEKTSWKEADFVFIGKTIIDKDGDFAICLTNFTLRWIMDFNKKLGFLSYHSPSLRSLSSVYSARIYLLMSQWYSRRWFRMNINEFQKIIGSPNYSSTELIRTVFIPVQKELEKKETLLRMKFTIVSEDNKKGKGRKQNDTVVIKIYDFRIEEEVYDYIENDL